VLGRHAVQAGWQLPEGQWWIAINVGESEVELALPDGALVWEQQPAAAGRIAAGSVRVHWVAG